MQGGNYRHEGLEEDWGWTLKSRRSRWMKKLNHLIPLWSFSKSICAHGYVAYYILRIIIKFHWNFFARYGILRLYEHLMTEKKDETFSMLVQLHVWLSLSAWHSNVCNFQKLLLISSHWGPKWVSLLLIRIGFLHSVFPRNLLFPMILAAVENN